MRINKFEKKVDDLNNVGKQMTKGGKISSKGAGAETKYGPTDSGIKGESVVLVNPVVKRIHPLNEDGRIHRSYGIKEEKDRIGVSNFKDIEYTVVTSRNIFRPVNPLVADFCRSQKIMIFISQTIANLYGLQIQAYFKQYFPPDSFWIQSLKINERGKTLKNVEKICLAAKRFKLDRKGLMIAVGGGVLNDLVGFSASIYKRGINYLQINTTLVGQIDVAVGIKTAVNFGGAKNFLGSFYPPVAAINDPMFLLTLPVREIKCGLAEILKMALICDHWLFELLEQYGGDILTNRFQKDETGTKEIMHRAMLRMIEELYPNLYEWNLERLVDFGHTFSPRIEVKSNYRIRHGEAVAIDMAISCRIAHLLGYLNLQDYERIMGLYMKIGLPFFDEKTCEPQDLWDSLEEIYLHRGLKLNFITILRIGKADFIREREAIGFPVLEQAVNDLRNLSRQDEVVSAWRRSG